MKTLLILLLCLTLYDCGKRPSPPPAPTPPPIATPTPTPEPEPTATPTPVPSPTILPCVNAGDVTPALLEAIATDTTHTGGGCLRSQLVVDGTLRLGNGFYQHLEPILVKSHSSVTGSWDTVIQGPNELFAIQAYNSAHNNAAVDENITLRGFKITGAGAHFNSAYQTVSMGNCHRCVIDGLWLDGTRTIGIQLGGGADFNGQRTYALNSKITNNLLTRVASQAIAVVNGENIEVSGNRVLRPGQVGGPGNTSIDLETNAFIDRLINIQVINNVIDHRGSEMPTTGNGIIANSGDSPNVENIVIAGNTIIGGTAAGSHLSNGIMVFGTHMQKAAIAKNTITRTGQTGIWLVGNLLLCEDNVVENAGGGGTEAFRLAANNSQIRRNTYKCTADPCDSRMVVTGTGNTIEGNTGWAMLLNRRPKRK